MGYEFDKGATARLEDYFDNKIGRHLRDCRKRASFSIYALGLLGESERKSAEPLAARACSCPDEARAMHDKLLHFLRVSRWDDRAVRLEATRYGIEAMSAKEPVVSWIVDDTGFLKQGTHSVGVKRQYTGSAGKITNCQVGVSLCVATVTEHLPVDFELYVPESWTEDAERREAAHVPEDLEFKTKIKLAVEMMRRAAAAGLPGDLVLADSAYGRAWEFRAAIRALDKDYAVAVDATTRVWSVDRFGCRQGEVCTVRDLAKQAAVAKRRRFRTYTWREASRKALASRFYFARVVPARDDGPPPDERERVWLVAEWSENEEAPTDFVLTTLPARLTKKQIVRLIKYRWRTERMYEDLKGELGLDHFEGRSFPGWHHHISVALCCYAFVVAERVRHFPPSGRRSHPADANGLAA
jgi:SRSO17 transposase